MLPPKAGSPSSSSVTYLCLRPLPCKEDTSPETPCWLRPLPCTTPNSSHPLLSTRPPKEPNPGTDGVPAALMNVSLHPAACCLLGAVSHSRGLQRTATLPVLHGAARTRKDDGDTAHRREARPPHTLPASPSRGVNEDYAYGEGLCGEGMQAQPP